MFFFASQSLIQCSVYHSSPSSHVRSSLIGWLFERMSQSGCRHICAGTCRRVSTPGNMTTCADMCRHMPKCDIIFGPYDTNDLDLHADICQHMWTCWHVLICADMCRHVLIWADMCRYVPTYSITRGTSDTNHLDLTCMLACVSTFGHADMCWYVPTCADMCRHVATYSITFGTSDTNHLDLTSKLACVSTCGHADMCQHVPSLSAYLIRTLWILSAC